MGRKKRFLFISFSITKWDSQWYVRQKLMNEFAKSEKVYVNPRVELRSIFKELRECTKCLRRIFGIRIKNKNLLLIESPLIFPKVYKNKLIDSIIERLYHLFIKVIACAWGKNCRRVLYIWEPHHSTVPKYYPNVPYCYHPYDHFERYCADNNESLNDVELTRKATCFYTVSDLLCDYYEKKVKRRPVLLPNGVDEIYFELDNENLKDKARNILSEFKSHKIGYLGSIKGIMDLDIVISSAKVLQQYDFLFIGEVRYLGLPEYDERLRELFAVENIHHIGPFKVDILPYLLQEMDILIMLYGQNPDFWTYYGGPAKLFEYMAAGKPIISTPHPSLINYRKYISIVNTPREFIRAVRESKRIWPVSLCSEMVKVAKENTWAVRKEKILKDLLCYGWYNIC